MAADKDTNVKEMPNRTAEAAADTGRKVADTAADTTRKAADATADTTRKASETTAEFARLGADTSTKFAETGSRIAEQSVDQFNKLFTRSFSVNEDLAQQASRNVDVVLQSVNALTEGYQQATKEWLSYAQDAMQKNVSGVNEILRARTFSDVLAIQGRLVREEIQALLNATGRISELSAQAANDAAQRLAERAEDAADEAAEQVDRASSHRGGRGRAESVRG